MLGYHGGDLVRPLHPLLTQRREAHAAARCFMRPGLLQQCTAKSGPPIGRTSSDIKRVSAPLWTAPCTAPGFRPYLPSAQ
jgi:hypothetical protein